MIFLSDVLITRSIARRILENKNTRDKRRWPEILKLEGIIIFSRE